MQNYFTYTWFKDIWLPIIGAAAIPLLIWFLTWYYGADKAEARKSFEQLRDNLNFLVSISLSSINSLDFLNKRVKDIQKKEYDALSAMETEKDPQKRPDISRACYGFVFDNMYSSIDLTKYAKCIKYNKDFVLDITLVKSLLNSVDIYIAERNRIVQSIASCENEVHRANRYEDFIINDYHNTGELLYDICRIVILLTIVIENTRKLAQKIKQLGPIEFAFTQEQLNLIQEAGSLPQKKVSNG